jgi:hypothetical protein
MRKGLAIFATCFASCVIAIVLVVAFSYLLDDAITHPNCQRIQKGMTWSEVEAILGGPSNSTWDYYLPPDPAAFIDAFDSPPPMERCPAWSGRIGRIQVRFHKGKVKTADFFPHDEDRPLLDNPSFGVRIYRLFGL